MTDLERLYAARLPLVELLRPREAARWLAVALVISGTLGGAALVVWTWPVWAVAAATIVIFTPPLLLKWRWDRRRYGLAIAVLGALVILQSFHGIEHLAQFVQNHVLGYNLRNSNGILSPANSEWVHFVWNWTVLIVMYALVIQGQLRSVAGILLLAWSTAHTLEHTYLFIRYLQVLGELDSLGVTGITAQGLPGVLGQDGWLARADVTQGTFICRLPLVTSASKLDIHFGWNAGETLLLLVAAHRSLRPRSRGFLRAPFQHPAPTTGGAK